MYGKAGSFSTSKYCDPLFFLCLTEKRFENRSRDGIVHQRTVFLPQCDHPDDLAVRIEKRSAGIAADCGGGIHDIPLTGNEALPVAHNAVQHTDSLSFTVADGVDLLAHREKGGIPHLCRRYIGNDYRRLLPATMLFGAAFLLVVDNISRNLLAVEIPIGILTAFIGAPFFIYLMSQKGGGA